jgi:hypothetical protein
VAGGDSQSRKVTGTRYRVAGSKPGRSRLWYSEATYHVSHAQTVLNTALSTAAQGEKFWIEWFDGKKWVVK